MSHAGNVNKDGMESVRFETAIVNIRDEMLPKILRSSNENKPDIGFGFLATPGLATAVIAMFL